MYVNKFCYQFQEDYKLNMTNNDIELTLKVFSRVALQLK